MSGTYSALVRLGPGGTFESEFCAGRSWRLLDRIRRRRTVRAENALGETERAQMNQTQAPMDHGFVGSVGAVGQADRGGVERLGLLSLAERLLAAQGESLDELEVRLGRLGAGESRLTVPVRPLGSSDGIDLLFSAFAPGKGLGTDESDTKATENSEADPRFTSSAGILADDARARRRDRSQQGHRVRARRSVDQKGRPGSRAEQGSLFVNR